MKPDLLFDEVLERVWRDRSLQDALIGLYSFQQGGAYPAVPAPSLARLVSLGLAAGEKERPAPTAAGRSLGYHLAEYRSQVERDSLRPVWEELKIGPGSAVLDFGCGGGQSLMAVSRYRPASVTGVDRDCHAVRFAEFVFGREAAPPPPDRRRFFCGELADAGLPAGRFTHVICRLVLYRVRVARTLALLSRAAADGSRIYVLAHSAGYYRARLKLVLRNPAWLGYFIFVFFNGLLFAAFGWQVTVRAGSRRLSELFFTAGSLRRALRRNGFSVEVFRKRPEGGRLVFEVIGIQREKP